MPFDGIVTACVARDLSNTLAGGKIEKIYQPEQDEIVLSVHRDKEKYKVFLTSNSMNSRLHFISEMPPNPPQPPTFCMLLRKHLQSGKISRVLQKDTERIVEFWIDSFSELGYPITKKLIVEIMGKHSNIVLVDGERDRIIDCIKRVSVDVNRYRQLLPGMPYVYPPSQEKLPFTGLSSQDLVSIVKNGKGSLYQALVQGIMGFSPFSASALCLRQGLDPAMPAAQLTERELSRLFDGLSEMCRFIQTGRDFCRIWFDETGAPVDFHCFDHPDYSRIYSFENPEDVSRCAELFYQKKSSSNRLKQKSADLSKVLSSALSKLYLKQDRLTQEILQAEKADRYRLMGELLLANLYQIRPGMKSITVENYYDQTQLVIPLDPLLSPSDNSQRYYKKYNKAKTALKEKNIQKNETQKEIAYLESVQQTLENAGDYTDVEVIRQELTEGGYLRRRSEKKIKKASTLPPHTFYTAGGLKIQAGRNNRQNDALTLKTAAANDIWLHTKDIPGTHVILSTNGAEPSLQDLREAAGVAAYFSKGSMSENIPVDYTKVKFVKKPAGAKPGMVIFTHNRTLYVNPALPSNPAPDEKASGES